MSHQIPFLELNYSADFKMHQHQYLQNNLKRKRSFKRRRFMGNIIYFSIAIIVMMTQNIQRAQAVPAMVSGSGSVNVRTQQQQLWQQRYIRNVGSTLSSSLHLQHKENLKESLQQTSSTEVSLEQPQGQCLLDGEYVPETTVFCEKQVGCRAIQKTGHCCPDYKCDCQKDGKTYLNGDKLVDPETPCTVCYCQGGEILCSSVTCFHRDDCSPKYIPGVCCPEYDNCPVATSESSLNKTLLTTSTTSKPEIYQAENNPKITIKEITKPIEIRITDDNKAISIHQMLKPSTTSTTTTTTSTPSTTTTLTPTISPLTASTTVNTLATTPQTIQHLDTIKTQYAITNANNNPQQKSSQKLSTDNGQHKNGLSLVKGGFNGSDTLKLSASVAYPSTILAAGSSAFTPFSEVSSEVEDPVPSLSVFSNQGLAEDPSKVNIKREYFITTERVGAAPPAVFDGFGSSEYPNTELIYSQSAQSQAFYTGLQQTSGELDSDTAGSDNIYHIILTTDGPRLTSTSEHFLALKGMSTTEGTPFDDLAPSSLNPLNSNNNLDVNSHPKKVSATEKSNKSDYFIKSTTESVIQQHLDDDDSTITLESNPAYPSLPEDDFSLRDNNFQINDSDDIGDEPRSISASHGIVSSFESFKSTKHLEEPNFGNGGGGSGSGSGSGSDSGSGNGMLVEELAIMPSSSPSTEGSGDILLQQSTETYGKIKPAEMIQFMYSAEDSSEETRITNSTDFKLKNDKHKDVKIDNTSLESSETKQLQLEFEMGSGSGEIKTNKKQKEREPTTARPNKSLANLDIDEVHDASGNGLQDDPKLDVESLKVEETAKDSLFNLDKSPKNNILSVKIQPDQEKQFHDELH